ncbi:hypothetical protein [Hymenobacter glacieicola]|uniref:Uncharacterized protein n=1 Tax=Hymenobacter glacieicola TaxID=1562124 RepID=A0ABQ1X5I1_9BACT|nr:hypothetical protein [Hymenobacter glacieicola]GGG60856.1 hypothetical protein GCM10011378_41100 [Hymenobacter glacieicola]
MTCKSTPCRPKAADTIQYKIQFMKYGGQPVRDTPGEPTVEERKLNLALCFEELMELAVDGYGLERSFILMVLCKVGFNGVSLPADIKDTLEYSAIDTLDACCDLRVVNDGAIVSSGLQGAFEASMAEVHRTNMEKFGATVEEADAAVAQYNAKGIPARWLVNENIEANHNLIIYRLDTGKILKPLGWQEPDLGAILNNFTTSK